MRDALGEGITEVGEIILRWFLKNTLNFKNFITMMSWKLRMFVK